MARDVRPGKRLGIRYRTVARARFIARRNSTMDRANGIQD